MNRVRNFSFLFIVIMLVSISWFKMATPFLTVLFSYLALDRLGIFKRKWLSITVFIIIVLCIFYGFGYFSNQAIEGIPKIVSTSIPIILDYAENHGFKLPFSDAESLKILIVQKIGNKLAYLANFAKIATKEFVLIVLGLVIAISIFLNSDLESRAEKAALPNNYYSLVSQQIYQRFRTLYQSFKIVMGAQILISTINAVLTGIFLVSIQLPYTPFIIILAFLTGLLPIIGNLISNSVIFFVAVTQSLWMGFASLVFLVGLHKLEYFLNSRIVGTRLRTPMWLILIILIIGDGIMGIPGMIMAPVLFNYIKMELSQIEVRL
jgi:predicted PurR-regulated permease PerM